MSRARPQGRAEREARYSEQNHGGPLKPGQRRRSAHKLGHGLAAARKPYARGVPPAKRGPWPVGAPDYLGQPRSTGAPALQSAITIRDLRSPQRVAAFAASLVRRVQAR